ncbi:glutaminyl-peptide cyclotransferase-like isoform X1 [Oratosquilla oratoria]|uniref:glutaminyl-peptide cyclotransferase-like isoform X1 n=1 Tax=Oratosquilla oratoria TaxID=337810 RepID=UPI003F7725CE
MGVSKTNGTFLLLSIVVSSVLSSEKCERSRSTWYLEKNSHRGSGVGDFDLQALAMMKDPRLFKRLLDPILIPRVPDTPSHAQVQKHIGDTMKNLGWSVEFHSFQDKTPHGKKTFTNIVSTLDPDAPRHLVLACHYDSKYFADIKFIGATDSAVPCAMMLSLATLMKEQLDKYKLKCKKKRMVKIRRKLRVNKGKRASEKWVVRLKDGSEESLDEMTHPRPLKCLGKWRKCKLPGGDYNRTFVPFARSGLTLQLIFLDGEEAFRRWSATDSLYGARNLAHNLSTTAYPPNNRENTVALHRMDLFVLLDLIGTSNMKFYGYFEKTHNWYRRFVSYERRLHELGLLENRPFMFKDATKYYAGIQDDHIPFLERGVPVVHLIPVPFPSVWHEETDNESALDYPTIYNLNAILRAFVYDYLHLTM